MSLFNFKRLNREDDNANNTVLCQQRPHSTHSEVLIRLYLFFALPNYIKKSQFVLRMNQSFVICLGRLYQASL